MLFNSLNFAIFLPTVFFIYWFITKKLKYQNILLLLSSYFFYACWDYRFLFLLMFSTLLSYYTVIKMHESKINSSKKFWFWLNIFTNLGFLGFFKYYNFFAVSFAEALTHFGLKTNFWTLKLILPVGISFYTFHGLSYVIDVYKEKIEPVKDVIEYSVFVCFFPLLVAGPIERATHLLPQIQKNRYFDYSKASDGLRQILWGLVKKIIIADNCAIYANMIFNDSSNYSGSAKIAGALFFTFQIYCDFSGYSDIALGTARLFGIELLKNFSFPYFSRDIAEFWRRWHISLTTWFRDYLYIPLGGSRGGTWMNIRNTFIIFLVSGFWHGANWTFLAWGALNAFYFLPLLLSKKNRKNLDTVASGKLIPTFREFIAMSTTFMLTAFAWIFFRAESITQAFSYISSIFSRTLFTFPHEVLKGRALLIIAIIIIFMIIEWIGRENKYAIEKIGLKWNIAARWSFYYLLCLSIMFFMRQDQQQFIYFQF